MPICCSQCEKPAIVVLGVAEIPLCVDCNYKLKLAQAIDFQQNAIMANAAMDDMDAAVGLRTGGRMHVPELPRPPVNTTTINVNNSNVGVLNTGTIRDIAVILSALHESGSVGLEAAINALMHAVIQSSSIGAPAKNEILEQVSYVAQQVAAKPEDRKPGLLKPVVERMAAALGAAGDLATVWEQVEPVIRSALGL